MRLFILITLFFIPFTANAATYWVSPTADASGSAVCADVDGDADPGTYITMSRMDTLNCAVAGDTIMFKSGTYTGTPKKFSDLAPSGTSPSVRTKFLCQGDQTCIMAFSSILVNEWGMVVIQDMDYTQIGSVGHGFESSCANTSAISCGGIILHLGGSTPHTDVIVEGNKVSGNHKSSFANKENAPTGVYTKLLIQYNDFTSPSTPNITSGPPHGVYLKSRNSIVQYNKIKTFGGSEGGSVGVHCYHICTDNIIRFNDVQVEDLMSGVLTDDTETGLPGNNYVYRNTFKGIGTTGSSCMTFQSAGDNNFYFNNTCDTFTNFYNIRAGANNNTFKNNTCQGTCNYINNGSGTTCGGTCSTTNPKVTFTTHFTDPANRDYTLKAGSSLIDGGIATTIACNGTCDIGAHEAPLFASCTVEDGDASNLRVTFTNSVAAPLTNIASTGITTRRAGANNPITSATLVGDSRVDFGLTNAVTNGQAIDMSSSGSVITDSTLMGGVTNQKFVQVLLNQSCTNNVGAAATHVYTQVMYELHYYEGQEDTPVMIPAGAASSGAAENRTRYEIRSGGAFRPRFAITGTISNPPATGFVLYASNDGGGYAQIMNTVGSLGVSMCGNDVIGVTSGEPTTEQLSASGTFASGVVALTQSSAGTIDMVQDGKTELEFCVRVDPAKTSGTLAFRVYEQSGTPLGAYTVTPTVTVINPLGGFGM